MTGLRTLRTVLRIGMTGVVPMRATESLSLGQLAIIGLFCPVKAFVSYPFLIVLLNKNGTGHSNDIIAFTVHFFP